MIFDGEPEPFLLGATTASSDAVQVDAGGAGNSLSLFGAVAVGNASPAPCSPPDP